MSVAGLLRSKRKSYSGQFRVVGSNSCYFFNWIPSRLDARNKVLASDVNFLLAVLSRPQRWAYTLPSWCLTSPTMEPRSSRRDIFLPWLQENVLQGEPLDKYSPWSSCLGHLDKYSQLDISMSKFIISSNQFIASIAMTEPDAGSDLQGIRTTAKSVPNVFCLFCTFFSFFAFSIFLSLGAMVTTG